MNSVRDSVISWDLPKSGGGSRGRRQRPLEICQAFSRDRPPAGDPVSPSRGCLPWGLPGVPGTLPQDVQVREHVLLTWPLGPANLSSRTLSSKTEEKMPCSDVREGRPVYKACLHRAHGVVLPGPSPLTPSQAPGAQTGGWGDRRPAKHGRRRSRTRRTAALRTGGSVHLSSRSPLPGVKENECRPKHPHVLR